MDEECTTLDSELHGRLHRGGATALSTGNQGTSREYDWCDPTTIVDGPWLRGHAVQRQVTAVLAVVVGLFERDAGQVLQLDETGWCGDSRF